MQMFYVSDVQPVASRTSRATASKLRQLKNKDFKIVFWT
jgi:hypothetical protein